MGLTRKILFYAKLAERIDEIGNANVIIGGDWNLVMDFTLDYDNDLTII